MIDNEQVTTAEVRPVDSAVAFYPRLLRFGYALTRNATDAADLAQQSFLLLAQHQEGLRKADSVGSWLQQTLYREFLRRKRRDWRWRGEAIEDADLPAEERVERLGEDEARLIREAIDTLPPTYRTLIRLRYFENFDYAALAQRVRVPVGTIMSRLARARLLLAKTLESRRRDLPRGG